MPRRDHRDLAALLLRKASGDEAALVILLTLLEEAGHTLPDRLLAAEELTAWSVQFRYEDAFDIRLDRAATIELVAAVRGWAVAIVDGEADA